MANLHPAIIGNTGILKVKKSNAEQLKYRPDLGNVDLDLSSELNTNTSGQFNTITGGLLESCDVKLEPKQNLHGYTKPWVGGSGKNKLPLVLSDIKSLNTSGTWTDNTYNYRGVDFTVNTDDDENVISVKVNGTATGATTLQIINSWSNTLNADMILTGCPSGGSSTTFDLRVGRTSSDDVYNDYGSGVTVPSGKTINRSAIIVRSGAQADNLMFYPMLRLATVTDATFEPYTNICPITGHSSVEVGVNGRNYMPTPYLFSKTTDNGVTFTVNDDGKVSLSGNNTSGGNIGINLGYVTLNVGTYIISGLFPQTGVYATLRDGNTSAWIANLNVDEYTLTVAETKKYVIQLVVASGSGNNAVYSPMIRLASDTITTYEPYNPSSKTYTISLGQTVYGGSLDVVSGVLMADKVCNTFDGSNDETIEVVIGAVFNRISCAISSDSITNYSTTEKTNKIWSDKYEEITDAMSNSGTIGVYYRSNGSHKAMISTGKVGVTDVASARTWLSNNPVQICYVLATPIIIQLTPQQIETLIGENHLDVPLEGQSLDSLSYREMFAWDDVEKAINVKLDLSSVAPIEYTDKASQSYNQKQLFIKDNKLCQALASISSGASFTENTNFKYTTLAEIIEPLIP